MGDDEAREGEEQVHAQSPDPDHVAEHRDIHDADAIQWILEVVEQHPEGGDEANTGQLPDEDRHVTSRLVREGPIVPRTGTATLGPCRSP